jgi:hypothetical protein
MSTLKEYTASLRREMADYEDIWRATDSREEKSEPRGLIKSGDENHSDLYIERARL